MSVRTLLILRGSIAVLGIVLAVVSFADGRTVFGVLWAAFAITNVVLIAALARRQG